MPLAIAFRIHAVDTLPSTQSEARRRLESGEDVNGVVVRALRQTQGRGQRGRPWLSSAGGSYQTLVVRDPQPPSLGRGGSAVAVAVGLAETLADYGVRVGIKWPNDLYYRDRKLAGVLTEYVRNHLLVGVGINVSNDVPADAIGLRGWDLEGVHAAVLAGIQRGLDGWVDAPGSLPERFAAFDLLAGRSITIATPDGEAVGTAAGLAEDGALRLQTAAGVRSIPSGSVVDFGKPTP